MSVEPGLFETSRWHMTATHEFEGGEKNRHADGGEHHSESKSTQGGRASVLGMLLDVLHIDSDDSLAA